MITVTRALLHQIRSVLRRAGVGRSKSSHPEIIFRAASDGLRIQIHTDQLAIEYHHAGQYDAQELVVPEKTGLAAFFLQNPGRRSVLPVHQYPRSAMHQRMV